MPTPPEEDSERRRRIPVLFFLGPQAPDFLSAPTAASSIHLTPFRHARKALRWSRAASPCAVVVDSDSLRDGGMQFARKLRAGGFTGPLCLIGGDTTALFAQSRGLGVSQIYEKPIDPELLLQHLSRTIAAHEALGVLRRGGASPKKLPTPDIPESGRGNAATLRPGAGPLPEIGKKGGRVRSSQVVKRRYAAAAALLALAAILAMLLGRMLPITPGASVARAAAAARPAGAPMPPAQFPDDDGLTAPIKAALGGARGDISLAVVDNRGRALYEQSPAVARVPASTLKLLTAAAAFEQLGANFRFHTSIGSDRPPREGILRDLIITGDGDPALRSADLADAVLALHRAGVRRLEGGVVVVRAPFMGPERNPGWTRADSRAPYAAGSSAVSLDGNLAAGAPLVNIPVKVGAVLTGMLRARGIRVALPPRVASSDAIHWTGWQHDSAALAVIARDMLSNSNNFIAEQILRKIGQQRYGRASVQDGVRAETAMLRAWKMPAQDTRLIDGSGLAEDNRASATLLVALLLHQMRSPGADVYFHSLPVLGLEGTTAGRRLGSAKGRVRAKDGHLHDANALAGYVDTAHHGRIAFAFIANRPAIPSTQTEALENRVVDILAKY